MDDSSHPLSEFREKEKNNSRENPRLPSNVVALAGGVGGAKMAWGLAQLLPAQQLTVVVNTADDFEHLGLHVSPDVDTVTYTLANLANPETGWGLRDESWTAMEMLARYAAPTWFRIGDRDLATHILRTKWLHEGFPLTWVTRELAKLLGVQHSIIPMSDDQVRTVIETDQGQMPFQTYFVQHQWQPEVRSVRFEGIEDAQPSQDLVVRLRSADLIILCPSNPFVSIDPILALPAIRRLLVASPAPKLAVSPIVGGNAIKGPAAKMMRELGLEVSPVSVARHFQDFLTGFVLDQQDAGLASNIDQQLGIPTLVADTVMKSNVHRIQLARQILDYAATT